MLFPMKYFYSLIWRGGEGRGMKGEGLSFCFWMRVGQWFGLFLNMCLLFKNVGKCKVLRDWMQSTSIHGGQTQTGVIPVKGEAQTQRAKQTLK